MLTEWLGLSQHQARGTAMVVAAFAALSGALSYSLHGNVQWNTLLWAGIPALVCAPLAARWSAAWPELLLRRLFGVVLLFGALALISKNELGAGFASGWPDAWLILVGIITGTVAGVIGISGGPVLAPLFVLGLGMPQHLAQGSSLTARIPAIVSGVLEDQREGQIVWCLIPMLGIGAILGAVAGAHVALWLPENLLRWGFAMLLALLGLHEMAGRPAHAKVQHRPHSSYP